MAKLSEAARLEAVHDVLTNPRRTIGSVAQLAAEHGFDDLSAFTRAFRERYGSSPADLRKAVRKSRVRFGASKR